ncbi:site-specific integrase [Paeniglutamicibacter sp. ABSL32-1]|nr:site-specific integrase [Paeniglutamicibacter quisquiliarum]
MVNHSPGPMGGPLSTYIEGFREALNDRGYAESRIRQLTVLARRLDRWLQHKGLDVASLDDCELHVFLDALSAETSKRTPTAASFTFLLEYLRTAGATPWPAASTEPANPEQAVIDGFGHYLIVERGLGARSIASYEKTAGSFVAWLDGSAKTLQSMDASDVITFAMDVYSAQKSLHAKKELTGLRSFLRWAYLEDLTERSWADVVPSAAGHGTNLPKGLTQKEVDALLATCDRGTVTGLRNYAMLVLMSRLGLRAGEVSALLLKDVDWRAGEILVRGKGSCQEKLPLPHDVGSVLVDYLRHGRPPGWGNAMFLKLYAPLKGITSGDVVNVVLVAAQRAGIPGACAHRLRHTAGTQLLRAGSSLAEVGQVLRHRSPASTALYAKVDDASLRGLALPWPQTAP